MRTAASNEPSCHPCLRQGAPSACMTRILDGTQFGVYVLTYPGDFHLSTVLVRSIQQVSPGLPIMIIPGEGFDRDDHPFNVPIMSQPEGRFWPQIGHQDRKFWAFQGPFEKFLYLDADTICTRSLDDLRSRIARQERRFLYTQTFTSKEDWHSVVRNPAHPKHASYVQRIAEGIGTGRLAAFDPDYDFLGRCDFNTGVFASRHLAITELDLESLNRAEREFYRKHLGQEAWSWTSSDLFFRDQGRLNYLAGKLEIPLLPLEPDLICVPGGSASKVSLDDVEQGTCTFHVVHWTGTAPSPSFFCRAPLFWLHAWLTAYLGRKDGLCYDPGYEWQFERVGYSLWRHYYQQLAGPMPLRQRLKWSRRDLRRVRKYLMNSIFRARWQKVRVDRS
jgi:hypothetical protein